MGGGELFLWVLFGHATVMVMQRSIVVIFYNVEREA